MGKGLSFSPQLVCDRTKILGQTGGSFFFTPIGLRPYQNFGTYRRVFLFHPNWSATVPKFWDIQEGLSFSPQLVCDRTKILGHTGGSFFFTPIGLRPYQNFGTYRRVFLFHPNWSATVPKFWDIQEGLSFSPQLVCHRTKILGHTGGSFFFTPIWAKTLPKLRSRGLLLRQKVFYFFSPQLVCDLTKILGTLEKKKSE